MLKTIRARYKQGKNRMSGSKRRFYRKSLIMILLVSGIPGLIIGTLVYSMAGGRLQSELLLLHNKQIEHRAGNIDDQLTNLELMLSHWAFDPKFDYSLKGADFVKDFERARDITKTLLVMQGSNTMTKRVELYLSGSKPHLFDPEYSVLENKSVSELYDGLLQSKQFTYWTKWTFDRNRPDIKDLTLVHHIPGGSLQPFGTLLIRLDNQKVGDLLRTMMPYSEGETFLLQDSGELYTSSGGSSPPSPFVTALKAKIVSHGSTQGSFIFKWEGDTYTVSYGKFSRLSANWTYASASPIENITSPVVFVSKVIFTASFSALLLAAVLAWVASRRIYSPVDRLMNMLLAGKTLPGELVDEFTLIEHQWQHLNQESTELHAKLAEQLPHVKESFLLQLLQGYLYTYSEEDLLNRMEGYKWDVRDRHFVILYVQLTGIAGQDGKFKFGDEGLITFAAVNMIGELASQHFDQSDTINFHDLTAGLLLVPDDDSNAAELQIFSEELIQAINRILKMRVTIAISRPVPCISDIPLAFQGVQQAVSYRHFGGENQIIDMEELNEKGEELSEPQYPFTLEREFVQALRTGRETEANELLHSFLKSLSGNGAKEIDVQQGMLHLLGNVQHAIMVSGIHPNRLFKGANMYEQLSQIREPEFILAWFQEKVVAPFLKELIGRSDIQVKRMIEQAMIYLQQQYMSDISLDSCADLIGTNPFFLSKSFKQVTGKNFIDYLTELRMDKAKELLRESELKIYDVAVQVGYQHSYFNRIFKKQEGMTPTRYRELSRSS